MSRTENHVGTAYEVAGHVKGMREKAAYIALTRGDHILEDADDPEHPDWAYVHHPEYCYLPERDVLMYREEEQEDEDGHCIVRARIEEGIKKFDYTLSFYNGGGSFAEAMEAALKRHEDRHG